MSVHDLLEFRRRTHSQPGHRQDPYTLALCLEGGGMRGAVSAGMAQALQQQGYLDAFDTIYGASAGALIGAYLVARQLTECAGPVVTDILPSQQFVCGKRLWTSIGRMLLGSSSSSNSNNSRSSIQSMPPAMNLSMVLDDVLLGEDSEYALDMETFVRNDQKQPLRIVVSCAEANGTQIVSRSLGRADFVPTTQRGPHRTGLAACLEASMAVPAATGPLVPLTTTTTTNDSSNTTTTTVHHAFDAFVAEPIPYVSAVDEGNATHVVCLCTRPHGSPPRTSGLYERFLAPLFFRRHHLPDVAKSLRAGYAVDVYNTATRVVLKEQSYKGAAIWGLAVPADEPELSTTSLDRRQIVRALRAGEETVRQWLSTAEETVDEPSSTTAYEPPPVGRMMETMRNWTFANA